MAINYQMPSWLQGASPAQMGGLTAEGARIGLAQQGQAQQALMQQRQLAQQAQEMQMRQQGLQMQQAQRMQEMQQARLMEETRARVAQEQSQRDFLQRQQKIEVDNSYRQQMMGLAEEKFQQEAQQAARQFAAQQGLQQALAQIEASPLSEEEKAQRQMSALLQYGAMGATIPNVGNMIRSPQRTASASTLTLGDGRQVHGVQSPTGRFEIPRDQEAERRQSNIDRLTRDRLQPLRQEKVRLQQEVTEARRKAGISERMRPRLLEDAQALEKQIKDIDAQIAALESSLIGGAGQGAEDKDPLGLLR